MTSKRHIDSHKVIIYIFKYIPRGTSVISLNITIWNYNITVLMENIISLLFFYKLNSPTITKAAFLAIMNTICIVKILFTIGIWRVFIRIKWKSLFNWSTMFYWVTVSYFSLLTMFIKGNFVKIKMKLWEGVWFTFYTAILNI